MILASSSWISIEKPTKKCSKNNIESFSRKGLKVTFVKL